MYSLRKGIKSYAAWAAAAGMGSGGAGVVATDTLSLSHFEGTNGSTTYLDSVPAITWAEAGSGSIVTAEHKWGNSAYKANNAAANGESFTSPESGNWTLEGWVKIATISDQVQLQLRQSDNSKGAVLIIADSFVQGQVRDSGNTLIYNAAPASTQTADTWYHFALVREGNLYSIFANGNRLDSQTVATNMSTVTRARIVNGAVTGYVDDLRVSKVARYSGATYTVPSGAFSVD